MVTVVKLTRPGVNRVLNGQTGMTFVVDKFTDGQAGKVAHIRDYRFGHKNPGGFQIWSLRHDEYEIVKGDRR